MKEDLFLRAFVRHEEVLQGAKNLLPEIEGAGALLLDTLRQGKHLFACGNGGSAADAQHFTAELTCRYKEDRRPLPAIALNGNSSHMTAVANDYGFEEVFSRQIEALGREDDLLVAFTTSGSSRNVVRAIDAARQQKMKIIILTGMKGKYLIAAGDFLIAVPSEETARIQEMHELIYHAWCEYIDANITN